MAFATVAASGTPHTDTTNAQTKSVDCPAANSGDRLLLISCWDGNPSLTTVSSVNSQSWTSVFSGAVSTSVSRLMIWEIVSLTGSISSQTVTVDLQSPNSEAGGAIILRIAGSHASEAIAAATNVQGSSTGPNPGALNPAGWDVEDTLWFAVCGNDGNVSVSGYPSDFPDNQTNVRAAATGGAGIGFATLESAVASVDPAAFTLSASEQWAATTLGVRPGAAAAATRPIGRRYLNQAVVRAAGW